MIRKILRMCETGCRNLLERCKMYVSRIIEIKKFQDPMRVAIRKQVVLSNEQKQNIDSSLKKTMERKYRTHGISIIQHIPETLMQHIFRNFYLFRNLSVL